MVGTLPVAPVQLPIFRSRTYIRFTHLDRSLTWNEIDISITPLTNSTAQVVDTIEEIINKNEVIFQGGTIQIHIYNLNKDGENNSFYYFPGSSFTNNASARFSQFYVNFSTGEISARQYYRSSVSSTEFTKLFYR